MLGAGSLDAQEARGAPAARAPAWAFSLPCASVRPLSVHRLPIRSPHRPPVPPMHQTVRLRALPLLLL